MKDEIASLASVLVDYLEVSNGKLRLSKELLKIHPSKSKEYNKVLFDKNPLVRLVTPRQAKRARGLFKQKDGYEHRNPAHPVINSQ